MTKRQLQRLKKNLRRLTNIELQEFQECLQVEINHRRTPTKADLALAAKYAQMPEDKNPPPGFLPGDEEKGPYTF